jgi:hypothetical protein
MSQELIIQNDNLPEYMRSALADTGTEGMGQFIVPPRIKIIQPVSRGEYKEKFSPGDAALVPQMLRITTLETDERNRPKNESAGVVFTPLFFFPEFCAWNPLEAKGTLPMIREASYDPASLIAAKARDPKRRLEPCPEMPEKMIRFVEHLNFVVLIHAEGLNMLPAVMSFSRAEHRSGSNFIALIKMRMAPMYGCKFVFKTKYRETEKGQWYGIDVENPPEAIGAFVDDRTFKYTTYQYNELKKAHESRLIRVDHDFEDGEVIDGQVNNTEL